MNVIAPANNKLEQSMSQLLAGNKLKQATLVATHMGHLGFCPDWELLVKALIMVLWDDVTNT